MTSVSSIVCHHTAGPASGEYPSLGVVRDGRPGLDGPLAQLGLGRSGTVYVIAAGVCWHAGATFETYQDNWHAIGIEAEATGVSAWPSVQYDAYARLCRALADHYGVPYDRVLGHKEVAKPLGRKIDPNFSMPEFRARLIGEDLNWTDRLPDLYTANPNDSLTAGDTLAWSAAHAANARDRATEARDEIKAVKAELADLKSRLAQVQAGNVDYKVLAKAVADELKNRLTD